MRVTLLALQGCPLSSVSGPLEILAYANGVLSKTNTKTKTKEKAEAMTVEVVTEQDIQIDCLGGLKLTAHSTMNEVLTTDVLIVAAIGHPALRQKPFDENTLAWIRAQYKAGVQIVSLCTGAFLLAATGLLDGKKATTHWACERLFRDRFPNVQLQHEQMITQDGALMCSGGASAYQDMTLFLIRKYYGDAVAHRCAKAVLVDLDRHTQLQYAHFNPSRQHQDKAVHHAQDWLQQHASEHFTVADLACQANLSERQFKRRFKQATGESTLAYIQAVRVEMAKVVLETTNTTIERVAASSGYEDVRFFRQIFKRHTGVSPTEYRAKFGGR